MSFVDTIALPLFIFFVGVAFVVFVGSMVYQGVLTARAKAITARRNARLEPSSHRSLT